MLTVDGRIARQLIGADSAIDKEYLVRVEYAPHGVVREQVQATFPAEKLGFAATRLVAGWAGAQACAGGLAKPRAVAFQRQRVKTVNPACAAAVGLRVTALKRVRIGKVTLGDLPSGQWRFLRVDECF